jgi:hypothetical protein
MSSFFVTIENNHPVNCSVIAYLNKHQVFYEIILYYIMLYPFIYIVYEKKSMPP